jgi:hypothetical protein
MFGKKAKVKMALANFEKGEAEEGEHDRDKPEANDDLAFFPTTKLEVVVNGSHAKDTFFPGFVATDLEDHRECFHDEDAANDDEHELLLGADGNGAEGSTNREGSGIAHENRGRIAIEPKEAEAGTDQSHEEDGELADVFVVRDF